MSDASESLQTLPGERLHEPSHVNRDLPTAGATALRTSSPAIELQFIVDLMRDLSRLTDPQESANLYGRRLREGLMPSDGWVSVSRRGLEPPAYCITRSTRWKEQINPWENKEKLPLFTSGLLGELLYSNEPTVIADLDQRLREDDPAIEYLRGYKLLATLPQYDNGVALNMSAILLRDPARFPMEQYPVFVWQSNLWGRATLNLVLRKELASAYETLDRELHVVGEMQKALLPAELPAIPGLQVAAHYETSTRAGGDYYDFFDLGNGRWGILIADVSGHGTPAAVIMAITHAISHLHPGCGTPPGALLEFINRSLARRYTARTNTFVTAFYGVYDANARTLTYARAGHNPPRLLRHHQVIPFDAVGNLPLGIEDDIHYEERCEPLLPGDKIILYTDGITEARNGSGEMFDTHSLDRILCRCGSARDVLDRVLGALQTFTEGKPATDDRTLLVASVGKRI